MTATLATLRARVQQSLADTGAAIWAVADLDEAIRQALAAYTEVSPRAVETVLTLPGAGREVALASLDELLQVVDVWWPYDSLAESWPPNRVTGFRLDWDDGQPVLQLQSDVGLEPQADDEMRIWYTTPQHLDGLDGAAGTTLPLLHESMLVLGATAFAAQARAVQLASYSPVPANWALVNAWGLKRMSEFRAKLNIIQNQTASRGPAFGAGWRVDGWDV